MAEEKQSLKDAFYELLSEDMSLLSKPNELCEKLEQMVSTVDFRKYKAVEKAFGMNIGEGIFAAISDEERLNNAFENAKNLLENSGMQTARIEDVIGLVKSTISKIKEDEKAEAERLAEEAAKAEIAEVDFEEEKVPERI